MNATKTAVLLVNLGTPKLPTSSSVATYLNEFLTDERVLALPFIKRQLLVRGIIVPKRKAAVAKMYATIWKEEGSPLLVNSKAIQSKLQELLGNSYYVTLAMRYQNPSIESALNEIKRIAPKNLVILPLFPQQASATTGSVIEACLKQLKTWKLYPNISIISDFSTNKGYIQALVNSLKKIDISSYDRILFSFHGLPVSYLKTDDPEGLCCRDAQCCEKRDTLLNCYKASCIETANLVQQELQIEHKSLTCFQSRFGTDEWISPYTDHTVKELATQGIKKILVISPSFLADCLETVYELGVELRKEFLATGGATLDVVPCLNGSEDLAIALQGIIIGENK